MTRKKIPIKKIDNTSARQVTFSKRRRGLFKKAHELSTLCDAEIAVVVFSATGKLFEYASSSMDQVIQRRNLHPKNSNKLDQSSLEPQLDDSFRAVLSKEIAERTRELRHLRGEDIQELSVEELQKLEKSLEASLCRIIDTKGDKLINEIGALKRKGSQLMEENQRLKQQQIMNLPTSHPYLFERGQSLMESLMNNATITADAPSHQDCITDYSFLKLGLP